MDAGRSRKQVEVGFQLDDIIYVLYKLKFEPPWINCIMTDSLPNTAQTKKVALKLLLQPHPLTHGEQPGIDEL